MYSMLDREIEDKVLPWCERNNTGVLVYSPMHSGILTGKISADWLHKLPENDWRKHKTNHPVVSPLHTEDGLQAFLILQEELRLLAQRNNMSVGQLAVSWALRRKEVTSAIVGARKPGQIAETVQAAEKTFPFEEEKTIMNHITNFEYKLNDA